MQSSSSANSHDGNNSNELSLCDAYAFYESNRRTISSRSHPTSTYTGVTYDQNASKYAANAIINGKSTRIGLYVLISDAAFVHDTAEKLLKGASSCNLNFDSKFHYLEARRAELSQRGMDVNEDDLCDNMDGVVKLILMKISTEFTTGVEEKETVGKLFVLVEIGQFGCAQLTNALIL